MRAPKLFVCVKIEFRLGTARCFLYDNDGWSCTLLGVKVMDEGYWGEGFGLWWDGLDGLVGMMSIFLK